MPFSMKCAYTIPAYRGVAMTDTAYTLILPTSTATCPIGISKNYGETGQSIEVAGPGEIAKLFMNQTCVVGALVALDAAGKGLGTAIASISAWFLGIYLGPSFAFSANATGLLGDVLVCPQYPSID